MYTYKYKRKNVELSKWFASTLICSLIAAAHNSHSYSHRKHTHTHIHHTEVAKQYPNNLMGIHCEDCPHWQLPAHFNASCIPVSEHIPYSFCLIACWILDPLGTIKRNINRFGHFPSRPAIYAPAILIIYDLIHVICIFDRGYPIAGRTHSICLYDWF